MMVQTYSHWRDTCFALHALSQMMGKTKLACLPLEPEWAQVTLKPAAGGFSTGFIPHGSDGFEVELLLEDPQVRSVAATGEEASFALCGGLSVADDYERYSLMLEAIGHPVDINPTPQEMPVRAPFFAQTQPLTFDAAAAKNYYEQCLLAQVTLLDFTAGFRGKKTGPALYWGTFDLTSVLFSGKPCPYEGDGGYVERVALDEQCMEFGFWPGDETADDPAFFVLVYPFLGASAPRVEVPGAFFDEKGAKYVLRLEDVLHADDPKSLVMRFFHDVFVEASALQRWERFDWLTRPLPR